MVDAANRLKVIVWGTGNVGRPATRAVLSHDHLDLVGVIVSNPDKVGKDVGDLVGIAPIGLLATNDTSIATSGDVDAIVYTASGDFRPVEALTDIEACLRSGANVVTTSTYPLQHPKTAPPELLEWYEPAFAEGDTSIFVSGIDPGWAQDILPALLTSVVADIEEIRVQELFNYATYDAPDAVRELCGFGTSMDEVPPMLAPGAPTMVWGPMLHVMAAAVGTELDEIVEVHERLALDSTIEVDGMGTFDEGTQGAMRFEVQGMVGGVARFVIEHITRIDDGAAPEWPKPEHGPGSHKVLITGRPNLTITIEADDGDGNPAGGGNATAANRLVNAIESVCAAPAGIVDTLSLGLPTGLGQLAS